MWNKKDQTSRAVLFFLWHERPNFVKHSEQTMQETKFLQGCSCNSPALFWMCQSCCWWPQLPLPAAPTLPLSSSHGTSHVVLLGCDVLSSTDPHCRVSLFVYASVPYIFRSAVCLIICSMRPAVGTTAVSFFHFSFVY